MARRLALSVGALLAVLAVASTGASAPDRTAARPTATASAYGISVVVPGAAGSSAASASAPPDAAAVGGGFAYPADGSAVTTGALSASAFASASSSPTANAAAEINSVSLFGGEITAETVVTRVRASAGRKTRSGDSAGSRVTGLQALGQAVGTAPGTSISLADWGTLTVLGRSISPTGSSGRPGLRAAILGLHVHLSADHGGLPAGSDIFVGSAEATVQAGPPAAKRDAIPPPSASNTREPVRPNEPQTTERAPGLRVETPRKKPPTVQPKLTAGRYVFPVYGPVSWSDTFGAPRAAPVGWHHGVDIFAPLGAPVLAVSDGTLFSVGWNDLGGLRLWLRDGAGNEFYYAHLSAFSTRAIDGAQVQAGEVIGFVGKTGDAEGTPPHLHFEIHPVSMIYLGYDGAVNPTKYLLAWQKLEDVPITGVVGWAPPVAPGSAAPRPGAILLQVSDISSASGLDPASLRRALRGSAPPVVDGSLGSSPREAERAGLPAARDG